MVFVLWAVLGISKWVDARRMRDTTRATFPDCAAVVESSMADATCTHT